MWNPFEWMMRTLHIHRDLPDAPAERPCPICRGTGTYVKQGVVEVCACEFHAHTVIFEVGSDGVARKYEGRS